MVSAGDYAFQHKVGGSGRSRMGHTDPKRKDQEGYKAKAYSVQCHGLP
jgi:hypothetical protein